ncbi:MAG: endonuclease/exonuclease/phosphatase family protein [Planctomycetota bacterium]|nr:endonuclease/exonuclease/phosphatase family protein [Planctomycetota bacterium]
MALTLLTHNVFWFQGTGFKGADPCGPDLEALEALAAVHREAGADLICLQEVQSEQCFSRYARAVDRDGFYCAGYAYRPYGGAILFHEGHFVTQVAASPYTAERFWMKAELAGGAWDGLVVANVHLPSGRQSGAGAAAAARLAELRGMLASGPRPSIVCGDFNERPDGPAHALMEAEGYRDAALLAGIGAMGTGTFDAGKRIDYVWLDTERAQRLKSCEVLPRERLARDGAPGHYFSDHLPVRVRLE